MDHNHHLDNHKMDGNHGCCSTEASRQGPNSGAGKHEGHSTEDFKKRFFVSLVLTAPVLLLSPLIQSLLGYSLIFAGNNIVLLAISTFVFFYGGKPFLAGAWREIKDKAVGMMTLISLAIVVAYFYSAAVVFGLEGEVFFWELVTLVDIMLLGHWIEMKSVMGASMALEKLSALIPDNAHLMKDEEVIDVETKELKDGNIILIKPGEKIPTDGIVVGGESFVNESMLTGEAKPVLKKTGKKVIGGSVNVDGSLEVKVEGIGESSYLSKVINLVKQAQASKSKTQALADKAAFWLTIIAISTGAATFFVWFLTNDNLAFAIERTATVLVIACPHALGLAIPLVAAISTTLSAQNGLLIRNRTAFENARKITTIIFDKTGTLTEGAFSLKKVYSFDNRYSEDDVIKIASALEQNSEHPIARAIIKEAKKRKTNLSEINDFKAIKGKGIEALVDQKKFIIASPGYLGELGLSIPACQIQAEGTMIFVVADDNGYKLIGGLSLSDTIRKESYEAIKSLKEEGIRMWMLTGDNESSAKKVAEELKLDGYFSQVLPHEKQEKVQELQARGEYVAMAGDGVNDAPALAQADVGIAIGSGTDIAAETADIILVNSNPKDIVTLIYFGKATYKKMAQNLAWATGYNVFAIPLAAGILASWGIILSPAFGAILMSISTVVVAANARLLSMEKRKRSSV